MKRYLLLAAGSLVCFGAIVAITLTLRFPADAQHSVGNSWEYAAITGTYVPYPAENPGSLTTVAVNICYVQATGCRNEEVTSSVSYAKFFQDYRLENNEPSRIFARNRARDDAFTKAIAKLGQEGWELASPPSLQFDTAYANPSGTTSFNPGNSDRKVDIYFKRRK